MNYSKNLRSHSIHSDYYYQYVRDDTGYDLRMFVYSNTAFRVIEIINENIRDNVRLHLQDLEKHARLFPD